MLVVDKKQLERSKMNYNFLKGKIIEHCGNYENYAKELGISRQALSVKLNGESSFTQSQIFKSIEILHLDDKEVRKAFFSTK